MSQLFPSGGQSIGASALAWIIPVNTQGTITEMLSKISIQI